jgi:nicotinate-nucleotide adenylyltransferase
MGTAVAPKPGGEGAAGRGGVDEAPRIGVLGGSFDPPHLGHLVAAGEVAETLSLDQLLLVPCGVPPHKPDRVLAPGPLRLRMLRESVEADPVLRSSGVELEREGPSWTVDTLQALARVHQGAELFLVMGADQWAGFRHWREPDRIRELAQVVVMTRQGQGAGDPAPALEVPVPRIDISSTRIRERVRDGRSFRFLVPDPVRRIIEAESLYLRES